jgi:hypothetical protein
VQFFQDGNLVYTATSPTTRVATSTRRPSCRSRISTSTTGKPIASLLTAVATDNLGFSTTSAGVSVTVDLGGSSTTTIVGTPPTVSITKPASQGSVVVNTPYTLVASAAATNTPGNITSVEFLIDNIPLTTATAYPYTATWTPTALGTYTISAEATDNDGNVSAPANVTVTVVLQPPPTVTHHRPGIGHILTEGSSITVTANASSPDGTIKQVQFYANGTLIGTSTTPPYSVSFTPTSTGVYSFTAIATDNSNATTTSGTNEVEVTPAAGGLGTVEYFGNYKGASGSGTFAYAIVDGSIGTFIGYTNGSPTALYYPDLSVSSGGGFTANAVNKVVPVNGTASITGVSGTLNPGTNIFIGALTQVSNRLGGLGLLFGEPCRPADEPDVGDRRLGRAARSWSTSERVPTRTPARARLTLAATSRSRPAPATRSRAPSTRLYGNHDRQPDGRALAARSTRPSSRAARSATASCRTSRRGPRLARARTS